MKDYQFLTYKNEDGLAIITIDRPQVYGALNKEAKLEIIHAIKSANRDESIKAAVITSNGKAFCSGQDLNDRAVNAGEDSVDLGHTLETEWNPLIQTIRQSKKIVIAAIGGACAGAGLSVALACDLIVARPKAKFVSGFSKLGLAPDAGANHTLVRALGKQKTIEFFLFNQPLTSEDLQQAGLVNSVSDNFLEEAKNMGREIVKLPPLAVELIKSNINFAMDASFLSSMERETSCQRFLGHCEDYKEGLNAFFEKREASFKGR